MSEGKTTQVTGRRGYDGEIEIDLLELLHEYLNRAISIAACTLLCAAVAFGISKFIMVPQYSSTAMLYIISKETTLTSLADLQIGAQLTNDYQIIVKSRPVLQTVIDELGLDTTYEKFAERITIANPQNTRILTISIDDADPRLAKDIVDAIATVASDYIAETMEMVPPKMIEHGTVATQKSSPSVAKNTAIGGLIGLVLACGVITVAFVLNDTVTTTEDVEKYLGISVLASVPERKYSNKETDTKDIIDKKKKKRRG